MAPLSPGELVRRRYRDVHAAAVQPGYLNMLHIGHDAAARAALGYRRAGEEALFLERYLDAPVERCLSRALGRPFERESVIEIGNLAADDAFAMISLWGLAANDLGSTCEIAVATLTAPLRSMLRRMGVELAVLADARIDRADDPAIWGTYYNTRPQVCAGHIAQGQDALARFCARRTAQPTGTAA